MTLLWVFVEIKYEHDLERRASKTTICISNTKQKEMKTVRDM